MQLKTDLTHVDFPVTIAIRTGESFEVEPWTGDPGDMVQPTYAVALFQAPDLVGLNVPVSPICKPTGLVLAGLAVDGWGWLPVETNTRNMIGDLLDAAGAKPGEWYKLTIRLRFPYQP